jgi:hypothetical protein
MIFNLYIIVALVACICTLAAPIVVSSSNPSNARSLSFETPIVKPTMTTDAATLFHTMNATLTTILTPHSTTSLIKAPEASVVDQTVLENSSLVSTSTTITVSLPTVSFVQALETSITGQAVLENPSPTSSNSSSSTLSPNPVEPTSISPAVLFQVLTSVNATTAFDAIRTSIRKQDSASLNTTLQQLYTPLFILLDQYRSSLARAQYQRLSDLHFFFSDGKGKLMFAWSMMEKALAVADWRNLAAATAVLDGYVESLLSSSMLVEGWIADNDALAHSSFAR